ncbi:riboflavin synthase subunit alpha [Vibrio ostreicida]|uniref:Riboflavin synthase n=1 Tax=Vibrio ostreicida TaxID=526588 RepID=A0ABT8BU25_9VIBR|nr:riboflavin synthase subunit alpha [Vibrio ostreicida]MDN3609949.1 riboflavin synthase subunit alpha [Vibrio ostreicida]NPD10377.1 riboflavin synthase subunit alpha [Vibrio ostreicida]
MFTGIIQSVSLISSISDHKGIRTFNLQFESGFCEGLEIGASVAVDGVCLTVTEILTPTQVKFDVMLKSLEITTLSEYKQNQRVNVERAAKDGAEIGGHPLSGHVDFKTSVLDVQQIDDNYRVRVSAPREWAKYIFPKGYIALNGASLTVSDVDKNEGWFDVWLIPETRRMTTFEHKQTGSNINVEIERGTQVIVDTVRDAIDEKMGALMPLFEQFLAKNHADIDSIGQAAQQALSEPNNK